MTGRGKLVLLLALAVGLSSCASSDAEDGTGGATTTSTSVSDSIAPVPPSTATSHGPTVKTEVEASYQAAARGFIEASTTSDPDHPSLTATHTGPMLQQRRKVLTGRRREGRAARQPPDSQYRIEFEEFELVDESTAKLTVCVVDDGVVYELDTGAVVNDRVETSRAAAVMRREDNVWKLAERELLEEWPGVAGCAAD